jgi:uncharacterized protein
MFRSSFLFILLIPVLALAYTNPGKPSGFVNDFAAMLSAEQKTALETKLTDFEKTTGNEIAIATITNLDGDTIENFAVKLFADWGIGKKDKDNGILLLISKDDKKIRIEVGYGLEGALTDAQSFWIIDQTMKPAFQSGDYYSGIDGAVDKIISATQGEVIPSEDTGKKLNINLINVLSIMFFVLIWLASILARSKSWWAGGVIGGVIGIVLGFINGFFYFGIISILVLAPLGLLLDYKVSKAYKAGKGTGRFPWWIGGGGLGGGSGLGGGGGFGGFGGGGSGGGGSSGGW